MSDLRGVRRYVTMPLGETDPAKVPDADRGESFWWWCRGCNTHHRFVTKLARGEVGPVWTWNGSLERPTFAPSLLYRWTDHWKCNPPEPCKKPGCQGRPAVCHVFVRNGQVQYLGDCTHELRGQTVPIDPPV